MQLLERRELAGDTFDEVGQPRGLGRPCGWRAQAELVASASDLQDFAPLLVGEQAGHGGDLAHLDRVSVETREDAVHAGNVGAVDKLPPAFEIPLVRLPSHPVAETVEIALDPRSPAFELEAKPMQHSSRSSRSSLMSTLPERKPLMLGWRTPLRRDRLDWVVPVSSITSRRTSLRLAEEELQRELKAHQQAGAVS